MRDNAANRGNFLQPVAFNLWGGVMPCQLSDMKGDMT